MSITEGNAVTLAEIEEGRLAVLRAYREGGYPFAAVSAGLTSRGDGSADLQFAVTEGYVADVRLEGDIGPAGTQVLRFLRRVLDARPASGAAIERALLLASDIPGVTVRGVMRPLPDAPGALQLVAQVERRSYSGYFNLDNRGFKPSGAWQGLFVAGLNSFTEFGERTEIAIFESEANNQNFFQGSVEAFVGGSGLRVRVYAGAGHSRPGTPLSALGYRGYTQVGGAVISYPIIRSRPANLYVVGQFDVFDSTVETQGAFGEARSRDGIRTFRAGLEAQLLDSFVPFLPAGTTLATLRLHQGAEILGATRSDGGNAIRTGSNFSFTKVTAEFQRNQPLFAPFEGALISLQALVSGQYSGDVLPTAEKFYLGGSRLGRGYYSGQVTGDSGIGVAIEAQLNLQVAPIETGWSRLTLRPSPQLYLFYDHGRTWESRRIDPDRRLSSMGGGLRLPLTDFAQLDFEAVHRITRSPDGVATTPLRENALFFRTLVRF